MNGGPVWTANEAVLRPFPLAAGGAVRVSLGTFPAASVVPAEPCGGSTCRLADAATDSCQHVWFYYWDSQREDCTVQESWDYYWEAQRETCIRDPYCQHTRAIRWKECSQCGLRLPTGETEIRNCLSGCQLEDYR